MTWPEMEDIMLREKKKYKYKKTLHDLTHMCHLENSISETE